MQAWINGDDPKNVEALAKVLNSAITEKKDAKFMAFFIFTIDDSQRTAVQDQLTKLADRATLKDLSLTYLSKTDKAVKDYKFNIDPEVKNTIFVYKNKRVAAKFVNFKADEKGLAQLNEAISSVTAQ